MSDEKPMTDEERQAQRETEEVDLNLTFSQMRQSKAK